MKEVVWVVGLGTMGSQIAQAAAMAGHAVVGFDEDDGVLEAGKEAIERNLQTHFVKKGKISADEANEIKSRIEFAVPADMKAALPPAFVLEAVWEDIDVKGSILRTVVEATKEDVIVATNTSGLSVTTLSERAGSPERVAGFHFFNPVLVMPLVEIVRTQHTSSETVDRLKVLARSLGKEYVVCPDVEGFIANRLYEALLRQAFWLVFERLAAPWDVDKAMKLGYRFPIGPLELQDKIATWGLLRYAGSQERLLRELSAEGRDMVFDMIKRGYTGSLSESGTSGIYEYFEEVVGLHRDREPAGEGSSSDGT